MEAYLLESLEGVRMGIEETKAKKEAERLLRGVMHNRDYYDENWGPKWYKDFTEALVEIGEPAVKPLIKALKYKDEFVREFAAEVLGEMKDKRAVEPLIKALKDKDKYVREAAADALGDIGDDNALEPLTKTLKDKDEDVRFHAELALRDIKKRLSRQVKAKKG